MIFVSPHRLEATFNILGKAVPPKDTWFYVVLVLPWTLDSICKKIKGGRKRCMFQTVGPTDTPGIDRGFNLDLLDAFLEGGLWERGFSHLNFLWAAQCWSPSLKTCLKKWELVEEKKEKSTGHFLFEWFCVSFMSAPTFKALALILEGPWSSRIIFIYHSTLPWHSYLLA